MEPLRLGLEMSQEVACVSGEEGVLGESCTKVGIRMEIFPILLLLGRDPNLLNLLCSAIRLLFFNNGVAHYGGRLS